MKIEAEESGPSYNNDRSGILIFCFAVHHFAYILNF